MATLYVQEEKEMVWCTCSIVSATLQKLISSPKTSPWYKSIFFIENTDCDWVGDISTTVYVNEQKS